MGASVLGGVARGYISNAIPAGTLAHLLDHVAEAEPFAEWQKRPLIRAYTEIRQAQAEFQQGNHQESIARLDAALELKPKFGRCLYQSGNGKFIVKTLQRSDR